MKQYTKNNQVRFANEILVIKGNSQIINPSEVEILEDGWKEYVAPAPMTAEEREAEYWKNVSYEDAVDNLIRERYSLSQELAILRQKNEKPEEFKAYFAYAEECKATAKAKKGLK